MRARLAILGLGAALAAGCGHPHPAPDPQLIADLQAAIASTTQAMGRPIGEPAATAQAQQLAWACDPVRVRAIRSGALGAAQVAEEARALARRIARASPGARPPDIMTWLDAKERALDRASTELLDAVRAQAELELRGPAR